MADLPSQGEIMTGVMRYLHDGSNQQFTDWLVASALGRGLRDSVTGYEENVVFRAVQELMAMGLVVAGMDRLNNTWPWLSLTERGQAIAQGDGPPLHDPQGYLADLHGAVPELDEDALQYAGEAVQAFALNLLRAATVMIGTASEILIQRLIASWADAVGGTEGQKLHKVAEEQSVASAFAKFKASFEQHKTRIDERRVKQDTMTVVEQVFHFIRLCRNDAGHAIGFEPPDRPLVQAHLVQFRYYARRLYDLIAYLDDPGLATP